MNPLAHTQMSKIDILYDRSHMLSQARRFFQERNIAEVDCPIISRFAPIATHIDIIPTFSETDIRYLHSSPEHGMKRLLVEGMGDIYQLSHVFRDGEESSKHNPEFTMVEWYLVGKSFETMMTETIDFIRLFVGDLPFEILSYRDAFKRYVGIDYVHASTKDLVKEIHKHDIHTYEDFEHEEKDAMLNWLLGVFVEPQLGQGQKLTVLSHYPASQAALSQTFWNGDEHVAERFEVYYQGVELANGYHELTDPTEQKKRFDSDNEARKKLGKNILPVDENFLQALEKGLPDCCGVAVGFDRLMMIRHQTTIANVLPFSWNTA